MLFVEVVLLFYHQNYLKRTVSSL